MKKPLSPSAGKSGFVKNNNERSGFYDVEVSIELVHASDQLLELVCIAFDLDHAFVQGFLQGHGLHGNKGEVELVSGNYCIRMIDRFSFSVHQYFILNPEAVWFSVLVYPVESELFPFGFLGIETDAHVVKQHFRREVGQNILGYKIQRVLKQAVSQFVGADEKFIAPGAGFRLVAELFKRVRRQISCLAVLRIGKTTCFNTSAVQR